MTRPPTLVVLSVVIASGLAACTGGSGTRPATRGRCHPQVARAADLSQLDGMARSAHQMELMRPPRRRPLPTDPATRERRAEQLRAARRFAATVPTARAAARRGYVLTLAPEVGSGAHWTDWDAVGCRFDPAHPAQVLTDGTGPDAAVVALSYLVVSRGRPPVGFADPNARWHRHFALCIRHGALVDRDRCAAAPLLDGRDLWMLHAWVVPGWSDPWGTFAPLNPRRDDGAGASVAH